MANVSAAKQQGSKAESARPAIDLRAARTSLIEIYRHGQALFGEFPERGHYQQRSRINRAKELRINPAELNKQIAFANKYDEPSLQKLLSMKTPQNKPLSWEHVRKLLTISRASQRHRFAKLATENSWSVQVLSREIEGWRMRPKRGGRSPRQRRVSPATLRELEAVASQVCGLLNSLRNRSDGSTVAPPLKRELAQCQKLLPDVSVILKQLARSLNSFVKQLGNAVTEHP